MKLRKRLVPFLIAVILLGIPVAVFAAQLRLRPPQAPIRLIDILAAVPESGGFKPGAISVAAGETVTLRFKSTDVTHSIAIGPALGIDLGQIDPETSKEVTLTFDQAGTYTFYCNSWCSPKHWRMRGVVQVQSLNETPTAPPRDPVIDRLIAEGVDIDAVTMQDSVSMSGLPPFKLDQMPSATRGSTLLSTLSIPADLKNAEWRRTHTPVQALDMLVSANPAANKTSLLDGVAALWWPAASPLRGADLYAKSCAACHGPDGDGKGPFATTTVKPPASFTDLSRMFARRSDVLYAKIRRGGMGTDMPNFGTLFTSDETWSLVDYLWTLTLKEAPPS